MNHTQFYKTSIPLAIVGLLWFSPVKVEAQENTQLTIEPDRLIIAGTENQKIRRTLTLTADRAIALDNLEISFRDLYRTDELEVFPAEAQVAELQGDRQGKLEYKIPLEFDLQQSYGQGEFSGNIILRYQQSAGNIVEVITLPVIAKIKSNWYLPFLTLLLGTGIGMGLSWYRSKGRPRDEILVRVGRLRTWMQKDSQFELSRGFKSQIEYQLNNVRSAVQEERWQDAEADLTLAKTIWQKWHRGKTLLLPQLEYASELEQTVADIDPQQPFKRQILYEIAKQVEQAPDLDNIEQLRTNLNEIASKINTYHQLQNQWAQIEDLGHELAHVFPEGAREWQPKLEDWQQQFNSLTPDDDLNDLLAELKNAALEINEAIPRGRGIAEEKLALVTDRSVVGNAPMGMTLNFQKNLDRANLKLKTFAWVSYAIALILLVGAGFSELYLDNETFGNRPFRDYFALLAWGFGAEASREAIAKAVEGWGLAGLDKE